MTSGGILSNSGEIDAEAVIQIRVEGNNGIPNNPDFSALIYPNVIEPGTRSDDIKSLYARNHWVKSWVYSLFDFHHYHYAAHEVLSVISGRGVVQISGENGTSNEVNEGDVIILPAGYGHRLQEAEGNFTVVGAYPEGQADTGFSRAGESTRLASIEATAIPAHDPIYGADGPLTSLWRKK